MLTAIDSTAINSMNLIGDSASTTNVTNDVNDLTNPIHVKERATVGGNKTCTSIAKGTWTLEDEVRVELENALCVPDFGRKVISFPLSLDQDGILFGEGHFLKMTMPDMTECLFQRHGQNKKCLHCLVSITKVHSDDKAHQTTLSGRPHRHKQTVNARPPPDETELHQMSDDEDDSDDDLPNSLNDDTDSESDSESEEQSQSSEKKERNHLSAVKCSKAN